MDSFWETFKELDKLAESVADIQLFKDKFGEDTYNNFIRAKDRLKNKGLSTDITWYVKNYEVDKLKQLLVSLYNKSKDTQIARQLQGTDKDIRGKYEYLGNIGGYDVYHPQDYLSSMDLGVNSGWCTTGRYGHYDHPEYAPSEPDAKNHFDTYTRQGYEFYYLLDPKTMYGEYAIAYLPIKSKRGKLYSEYRRCVSISRDIEESFGGFNTSAVYSLIIEDRRNVFLIDDTESWRIYDAEDNTLKNENLPSAVNATLEKIQAIWKEKEDVKRDAPNPIKEELEILRNPIENGFEICNGQIISYNKSANWNGRSATIPESKITNIATVNDAKEILQNTLIDNAKACLSRTDIDLQRDINWEDPIQSFSSIQTFTDHLAESWLDLNTVYVLKNHDYLNNLPQRIKVIHKDSGKVIRDGKIDLYAVLCSSTEVKKYFAINGMDDYLYTVGVFDEEEFGKSVSPNDLIFFDSISTAKKFIETLKCDYEDILKDQNKAMNPEDLRVLSADDLTKLQVYNSILSNCSSTDFITVRSTRGKIIVCKDSAILEHDASEN